MKKLRVFVIEQFKLRSDIISHFFNFITLFRNKKQILKNFLYKIIKQLSELIEQFNADQGIKSRIMHLRFP